MNTFRITAPATSANIGAGFDCMGLAVQLCNTFEFCISPKLDCLYGEKNLVVKTMRRLFRRFERQLPPFKLMQNNLIPFASGLGSSAACVAAGAVAANLMLDQPLSTDQLAHFCTLQEGHPDNAVPALIGGITASVMMDDSTVYRQVMPKSQMNLAVFTPDYQMRTHEARAILPATFPLTDFVYNCSRSILIFNALADGDIQTLDQIMGDRLHQPYRLPLIEDAQEIISQMRKAGIKAIYLSGAGPSIAGFIPPDLTPNPNLRQGTFRILPLTPQGTTID